MTDPAIIEAAERALEEWDSYQYPEMANAVLAAVTPLILERAAKVAEEYEDAMFDPEMYSPLGAAYFFRNGIAAAIRALKEQP